MPRRARKKAESGVYHVMLRGIDRQMIFEDSEDSLQFLHIIQKNMQVCNFKLYAYCLMGNHVHLLIRDPNDELENIFKRIAGSYVYYFNAKYQRVGHLFQDRFKSEPVEDDAYFLTVLRYIHQNPVKGNLCKKMEEYPYSSYTEYIRESKLADTEFALGMVGLDEFIRFHNTPNDDICLEATQPVRRAVTDAQARLVISKIARCDSVAEFQKLEAKKKEQYIKKIHKQGVSIRQLSKLTGTSKGIIEKYLK